MHGPDFPRPRLEMIEVLQRASVASITTILGRRGVPEIWMPLKPLFPGMRTVGPALTIRSVPGRGDKEHLSFAPDTPFPRHPDEAIEAVQPGDVVVHDGLGITSMGLFGDLLTQRIAEKGGVGLVSDMCIRDAPHMAEKEIPIFCRGAAGPGGKVFNVDYNVPIACAGVLVCPGDILVGDDDGVAVIPWEMLADVVEDILDREDRDAFIRLKLAQGTPLRGLYPMGPEMELEFERWLAERR